MMMDETNGKMYESGGGGIQHRKSIKLVKKDRIKHTFTQHRTHHRRTEPIQVEPIECNIWNLAAELQHQQQQQQKRC